MAAAPTDALGAFTYLTDNLPAWIIRVSELAAHASAKHAEFAATYRRHTTGRTRRRKNSSVCSIHTEDMIQIPIAEQISPRASPRPEAVEASTDQTSEPTQTGHKRRTDEAPSIDSAERYAYVSTRHNVIIEYDGYTQRSLEGIVQDIGRARNNLRRAKMATMPHMGVRSNLLNKAGLTSSATFIGKTEVTGLSRLRSLRSQPGVVGVRGASAIRQDSPFDYADKQLELANGLCETAAYQILRSGDCAMELDSVEEKFRMVLDSAKLEMERLQGEQKPLLPEERAEKEAAEKEVVKPPPTPSSARMAHKAAPDTSSKASSREPAPIEVDDDSSSISAESIDLAAFRSSCNRT